MLTLTLGFFFVSFSSIAILKYLSRENIIPESLYPRESKAQARLEEFLEWQHAGLRLHCAMYFRVKVSKSKIDFNAKFTNTR